MSIGENANVGEYGTKHANKATEHNGVALFGLDKLL